MVKVKKSIVDKIAALNKSGVLAAELRLGAVAVPLTELEDEEACLTLLQGLEDQAAEIEDPTAWLKEACKAAMEAVCVEVAEEEEEEEE
eukprot:CAMPEP_0171252970 /NCGR_PEP_ID=MMETSP0790-20130122/51451_1 /TAXON_ID=2925 /ORGANISM="Alexandrium catenella, Strain OF101" /LENGTH=88 /DNA_ID=CAMNT_0011720759 /DNA_START=92 /DNA_END=355 /DNA_ORIENTATION=+